MKMCLTGCSTVYLVINSLYWLKIFKKTQQAVQNATINSSM